MSTPLLAPSTVDQAQLGLSKLAEVGAALREGKLPSELGRLVQLS